jgi:hypothetical protein
MMHEGFIWDIPTDLAVPVLTAARAVSEIKQDAEEKTNDDKEGT